MKYTVVEGEVQHKRPKGRKEKTIDYRKSNADHEYCGVVYNRNKEKEMTKREIEEQLQD